MSKDTGGAAFPSHGTMGEVVQEGMTLRDYFAGQAMYALLHTGTEPRSGVATAAYFYADAMLAERYKTGG